MDNKDQIKTANIKLKKLRASAAVPVYGTDFSAGADLVAAVDEPVRIKPGETLAIGTGIALEIPTGLTGLVFGRSGLASKRDLAPANKVGVIDSDYRGEITVCFYTFGNPPYKPGERIAQLLFVPAPEIVMEEALELSETERGAGGYGSTGA